MAYGVIQTPAVGLPDGAEIPDWQYAPQEPLLLPLGVVWAHRVDHEPSSPLGELMAGLSMAMTTHANKAERSLVGRVVAALTCDADREEQHERARLRWERIEREWRERRAWRL